MAGLLLINEAKAQFGGMGGFGGMSAMDRARQERRFIEGYRKKKENGESLEGYFRSQTSFYYGVISARYNLNYTYSGGYSSTTGTTYFSGETETKVNGVFYGFGGEHYFPLSKLSDQTAIALTIGAEGQYLKFNFEEIRLNGGHLFTPSHDMLIFNLPIGLVYKSGTDVAFRKSIRSGASFGGGICPGLNVEFSNGATGSLRPYLMAEVAFYTGFCWKLRGTGLFGNTIISKGAEDVGIGGSAEDSRMNIRARSALMLSLIITDFSWDWDED